MSVAHQLPNIPPLPPLDIRPEPTSNSISSNALQSPTPSFATANASPSQLDSPTHLTPVLVFPPQALRKSLSADSLVSYGLNRTSASPSAQCRPSSPLLERYRHAAFKGQEFQRPVIRGGELPVPSRSQTPSRFLNRGVTAPSNSSPHENRPPLQSVTSLQSLRQAIDLGHSPNRRPVQWATLDELLDKLLFLAVSGDGMFAINLVGYFRSYSQMIQIQRSLTTSF